MRPPDPGNPLKSQQMRPPSERTINPRLPAPSVEEFDQDRRVIAYARFPIRTTFPSLRGTRGTTAALARSSKAVAMYFA